MPLQVDATPIELRLVHPFKIARLEESVAHTVIVRVHADRGEGVGEAAPTHRYGESAESVVDYFASHSLAAEDPYLLESLLHDGIPAAARGGLDLALHDLIGKELQKPLYALLGLDPDATPVTSFTIGIADVATTLRKVSEVRDHPILKIKLGSGTSAEQVETISAIRDSYRGIIRIDANEGWDVETAVQILNELERYDVELCEQPIPSGHPEQLRAIRNRVSIPLVADEDALTAGDLLALRGCVDGVNVKLAKTGGIRGALAMIHTARAMRLRVMIGCMIETAVAATAAAHLSPLADWADIDGPFLVKNDAFDGVAYDRGKLILPDTPGLGVREATRA